MKQVEKFELVLSVFRADSWKPYVDTFDILKKTLGTEVCEESWFKVFTRDYLYVKDGRVNTRNVGSAQTYLESLIRRCRTPEEEEHRNKERIRKAELKKEFNVLNEELKRKEERIKELENLVKEKDETISRLQEKLKNKESKIASLTSSKKYWEGKANRLELLIKEK